MGIGLVIMAKIPWTLLIAVGCVGVVYAESRASEAGAADREMLVYRSGDRVYGHLVRSAGGIIEFRSDRFGDLRVPVTDAAVVVDRSPPEPTGQQADGVGVASEAEGVGGAGTASRGLADSMRDLFGPWHGRLAFLSEIFANGHHTSTVAVEGRLRRKWTRDEVQAAAHYDYSETQGNTTTDSVRADGLWRHDFPSLVFALYRPALEWNRAAVVDAQPGDYLLAQQELGAGINMINAATHKVRVGLSENMFDVWTTAGAVANHMSRMVESAFLEAEWKLPWQMCFNVRSVWYAHAPGNDRGSGWENCMELSKRLTEMLSASMRHEIRRNSPDVRVQDYSRLKLLLGVDF